MKSPLRGKTVVLTRAREDAAPMARRLRALGASVRVVPGILVRPRRESAALKQAAARLAAGQYDAAAFTSARAALYLPKSFVRHLRNIPLAAVGGRTDGALRRRGLKASVLPDGKFSAAALARKLLVHFGKKAKGKRVLFPCAAGAREGLAKILGRAGVRVDALPLYETTLPAPPPRRRVDWGRVDALVFMSPSAVEGFLRQHGGIVPPDFAGTALCIGPTTARAARGKFRRVRTAQEQTEAALLEEIARLPAR